MSDPNDRDRGGRRRRRRDRPGRKEREREPDQSPAPPSKPPIILGLAKPEQVSGGIGAVHGMTGGSSGLVHGAASATTSAPVVPTSSTCLTPRIPEKPIVVLRSRDDNRSAQPSPSSQSSTAAGAGETTPAPAAYHIQRHSSVSHLVLEAGQQSRLAPPPEMKHSVKMVDEAFRWCDAGMEMLLDQSDFVVVGVLGSQGSGKSTIQSLLAGTSSQDSYRSYVFQPQTKEIRENGAHQTMGIDMYVSAERIIFLDTQPVLSASILDQMIHMDKKYPTEYTTVENCIEMQSLQLAAFMMTVCNVILVVQDWFTDFSFLRFLLNSEMLKPTSPSSGHDASGGQDDMPDYFPHIVFIQNKASREDFSIESYQSMSDLLLQAFSASKLKYRGSVTMARGSLIAGLNPKTIDSDINFFCLPHMEHYKADQDSILSFLPDYRGYPSFNTLLKSLRNQIYSIQRSLLTHTTLSEKNWFHYAARTWDAVKKSQLLSEYNRLLP